MMLSKTFLTRTLVLVLVFCCVLGRRGGGRRVGKPVGRGGRRAPKREYQLSTWYVLRSKLNFKKCRCKKIRHFHILTKKIFN